MLYAHFIFLVFGLTSTYVLLLLSLLIKNGPLYNSSNFFIMPSAPLGCCLFLINTFSPTSNLISGVPLLSCLLFFYSILCNIWLYTRVTSTPSLSISGKFMISVICRGGGLLNIIWYGLIPRVSWHTKFKYISVLGICSLHSLWFSWQYVLSILPTSRSTLSAGLLEGW